VPTIAGIASGNNRSLMTNPSSFSTNDLDNRPLCHPGKPMPLLARELEFAF
jgi:hypothetical protein